MQPELLHVRSTPILLDCFLFEKVTAGGKGRPTRRTWSGYLHSVGCGEGLRRDFVSHNWQMDSVNCASGQSLPVTDPWALTGWESNWVDPPRALQGIKSLISKQMMSCPLVLVKWQLWWLLFTEHLLCATPQADWTQSQFSRTAHEVGCGISLLQRRELGFS